MYGFTDLRQSLVSFPIVLTGVTGVRVSTHQKRVEVLGHSNKKPSNLHVGAFFDTLSM